MSVGWSRQKAWILFLISTSSIISAMDRSSLSVANTFIAKDLNLSLGQMGLVLSSFGWAYLPAMVEAFHGVPTPFVSDCMGGCIGAVGLK